MKNFLKNIFNKSEENDPVLFYGGGFNCFSNMSAYNVEMDGVLFMTSEHAYQYNKFDDPAIKDEILKSRSAYDSKMISLKYADSARCDWHDIKLGVMENILRNKLAQHPHIKKKLLDTGDRIIIEASKDDNFWGWGPGKNGENNHGKIWMKLRDELIK